MAMFVDKSPKPSCFGGKRLNSFLGRSKLSRV